MSVNYPIWFHSQNCNYAKGYVGFGHRETGTGTIYVGSGSKNSVPLLNYKITKRQIQYNGKEAVAFKFSIDDVVIKAAVFSIVNDKPHELIKMVSQLEEIKSLEL